MTAVYEGLTVEDGPPGVVGVEFHNDTDEIVFFQKSGETGRVTSIRMSAEMGFGMIEALVKGLEQRNVFIFAEVGRRLDEQP